MRRSLEAPSTPSSPYDLLRDNTGRLHEPDLTLASVLSLATLITWDLRNPGQF